MTERGELWILTDGRAGNVAQARGLAEALARLKPLTIAEHAVTLKPWAAAVPAALSHRVPAGMIGWPFSGISMGREALSAPWPCMVIGAGRRIAPVVAALKRRHGVTAVQLLDPRMPARAFDAVVVPEHDALTGANVLTSVGALNRLTPAAIAEAAEAWPGPRADLAKPRLAVLVGGPSRSARFTGSDGQALIAALEELSGHFGLMITTSRRTDRELATEITTRLGHRAMIWSGEADGPNPYPALLAHAQAALVTEDSVNMASEAASTGLPVHIFPVSGVAEKFVRFHESLAAQGATRRFTGEIDHWTYAPLAEADRIAAELVRRGLV
ncbi:MAG: mitochondrial fission ELM1 family protein [Pseudomonadota bacterium]